MFSISDVGLFVSENEVISSHPNALAHEDDDVHEKTTLS
jgi:hypothetical protein